MHVKCAYVSTWHVVLKVFVRLFRIKQEKASKQGLAGAIQLFQKTLSEEKQKVFKPRPQGNVGCFKSVFCWQTITPLNWSLIFIRHLYWTILIILVFERAQGKIMFQSKGTLAYSHLWKQFYKANWQGKITLNFTFYQFALRGMPLLHFLQLLKMMAMMAIFLEMNSKGRVLS